MCYNIDAHKFDQKSHFAQGKQVTDMKIKSRLAAAFCEIKNIISENYNDYCPVNAMFL